ncbi:MAG: hypothetical protein A3G52_04015 [Candidatus Taylorbacteria bacterium RIFCSPLOWO2_12_FULL_43_20]|uniref:Uncharacterized protein n=1 Tax=Candidatus Taylorbacteria bacterium RIFCSPLOWO2_12_FULL_43_20 TaxID=1802332 RepID=A0A1G2P2D3_9BACT|nr:MAG: hypothetical protein A2825_00915 [Candidatus Taylorbacteria bacterium RIFCSPHIGHO2_01_FULL_43_120]OHA22907.1 MAG: hypothetical protein A3B98_03720 [Candidatus Taylorbacteria bacterium RIFCSPHIGHO2_02_FULL_43_55]OHA30005.1 MAG: hypothetical protein A3E92_04180 [Candidatus Taylorbacteria bacterium RIFCSPHIGHO2_12_FULL_42_34]OHA30825.1 MAG: hypothetical protein A3B09_01360 [Candidatus Taylorbacteria bacterium RIFCSPLOWO2_01_FULL_43_83]OHA39114.1 MAG: hypothetical protein A3H58_00050 [Candi
MIPAWFVFRNWFFPVGPVCDFRLNIAVHEALHELQSLLEQEKNAVHIQESFEESLAQFTFTARIGIHLLHRGFLIFPIVRNKCSVFLLTA